MQTLPTSALKSTKGTLNIVAFKKYTNKIIINGETFSNFIEAKSYKEALAINAKRKIDAAKRGKRIFGRLEKVID